MFQAKNDEYLRNLRGNELVYLCGIGKGVITKKDADTLYYHIKSGLYQSFLNDVAYFLMPNLKGDTDVPLIAFDKFGHSVVLDNEGTFRRIREIVFFGYPKDNR